METPDTLAFLHSGLDSQPLAVLLRRDGWPPNSATSDPVTAVTDWIGVPLADREEAAAALRSYAPGMALTLGDGEAILTVCPIPLDVPVDLWSGERAAPHTV